MTNPTPGYCCRQHTCATCGRCLWLPCTTPNGIHPSPAGDESPRVRPLRKGEFRG